MRDDGIWTVLCRQYEFYRVFCAVHGMVMVYKLWWGIITKSMKYVHAMPSDNGTMRQQ